MVDKNLYNELKERGLIYQSTDEESLKKLLESGKPVTIYEGSDPTATSLHIGHCFPYCILRKFQKAGHKVIVLMGGATACIGDPTGKTELRAMLSKEQIANNIETIKKTLSIFLDFEGENPAIIVNNADWYKDISYIDFMREIGIHFNVNKMLSTDIYSNRLENGGLTFFEMGYMLMQAYDFVYLNKKYGCEIELGGSDQWANIAAGTELQRKLNFQNNTNINLIGMTNPLLLTPEGKKMGKTEKGAIWIDKNLISAYDFYQGIYQTPDNCLRMMFSLFTDFPMQKVDEIIKQDIVKAKKILSFEVTKFVRGEEDATIAQEASEALFGQGQNLANVPCIKISKKDLPVSVLDLMVRGNLCSSKGEAKRVIEQGGLVLGEKKITDVNTKFEESDFKTEFILRKGKKSFVKVELI